ncbi:MAG: tRNA (adenosine(37)-N6)-threonylcarbamoyltransferase complex dimerization subunit type 1 TsaB [Planctomycetaceae bacterium]|jgi:tRNA threonylcarbamoyladenosine biosynthesis protein TsaB|nr:tRNA (adenosine(37)-N6)-threonylcarbamoyltransferase complex dimerization subunit type 1 TsaB [Planctomycetaceae bacterium]
MWSLGLETSTRRGSVAIWNGQGAPLERSLGAQSQKHATTIFQVLDELLKEHSLKPADIGRIAVSIGPGSFTGLRIGVVAAKTLAYSLGCEVKGIDTFLAVAHQSPTTIDAVTVIGDAQRGDLFVGDFERNDAAEWTPIGNIRIESAQLFENSLTGNEFLSGPGLTRYSSQLQNRERLLEDLKHHPSAAAICELSVREDIPLADYWSLEPLYLRKSSAEEKWDQKQSKSV